MKSEVPKPLIMVDGERLIDVALRQAEEVDVYPIVLSQTEVLSNINCRFDFSGVEVQCVQSGAAMTLLAAAGKLEEDESVLVMDCDVLLKPGVLTEFAGWAQEGFSSGRILSALLCFKPNDDSSRYSFVREVQAFNTPDYPIIVEVCEKVRISNIASCGVHAFASWAVLRAGLCSMVHHRAFLMPSGEYYISPIHNRIGHTSYMLTDWFTHLGSKEELEKYAASK